MTLRNPLVVIAGQIQELPSGDSVIASTTATTVVDDNYSSVSLLLHGNGTNGGTAFVDNSPASATATVYGNAITSTAQSKFGGSSIYLDGVGDCVSFPSSSAFMPGVGDFTIEFWEYCTATPAVAGVHIAAMTSGAAATDNFEIIRTASAIISVNAYVGSTARSVNSASSYAINAWHHVAVVVASGVLNLYVDGVATGTPVALGGAINSNALSLVIGGETTGSYFFAGYLDDVRITKGVARYTANFTPHTTAHPDAYSITSAVPLNANNIDNAALGRQYVFSRGFALP